VGQQRKPRVTGAFLLPTRMRSLSRLDNLRK
jgi:hypothetical protein